MVVPGEIFQNIGSRKAGKRYFQISFCKYSKSQEDNVTKLLRRIQDMYSALFCIQS